MADVDLDALANEIATQHSESPEGMQSKTNETINRALHPSIAPKKKQEPWYTRMAHGGFLPGTANEITAPFKDWQSYLPPMDPISMGVRGYSAIKNFTQGPQNAENAWSAVNQAMPTTAMVNPIGTIAKDMGDQGGQAADAYQQGNYVEGMKHALGAAYAPVGGAQFASGDTAGGIGRAATVLGSVAGPHAVDAAKRLVPDQFKFDLYNSVFGEGGIDPKYKKEAGRGLSRAKLGPARRGQMAQPSADVHKSTGLSKDVDTALSEGRLAKNNILMTPEGQAKVIPVADIIEENFGKGSLQRQTNPTTGQPGPPFVQAKTATNVPGAVNTEFSEFGNRLLDELINRSQENGFKLSAADIEEMRQEKIIDPDYGKNSTNAPELSLNQKAAKVSSDLIKRAEEAVKRPDGQSALEYLNTHLSDLMHAKELLPAKLAESRVETTSPSEATVAVGNVKTPFKLKTRMKPPAGFGAGKLATIAKTGLSSWLTEKPWWLQDSTQGLTKPNIGPQQPYGPPAPPPSSAGMPPNRQLPPGPSNLSSGASTAPPPNAGGVPPTQPPAGPQARPSPSGAAETAGSNLNVGDKVAGFDAEGNLASGDLTKVFIKDGKPHGLVLDLNKGKAVVVPMEELRPVQEAPKKDPFTHTKASRPPGTEPAGIAGGPPIGPDEPFRNPEPRWGKGAHPSFIDWASKEQNRGLFPQPTENKYEVYHKNTGENIGYADTPDDAHILANSHDYFDKGNTGVRETAKSNVRDMTPELAKKKVSEWMGRLDPNAPNTITTSPEKAKAAEKLKFLLRGEDFLGFDTVGQAMAEIRNNPRYAELYNIDSDTIKAAEEWRKHVSPPQPNNVVSFPKRGPSDRPPGKPTK